MTGTTLPPVDPTQTHGVGEFKHSRPLTACCWDPLARYVFCGAEDHLVHRFDLAKRTFTPLAAHDSWVRGLAVSPDGAVLFSGGYDGRLIWWPAAAERPEPLRVVDAHAGWIRALAVSSDGRLVATCGNDRLVKIWDAAQGTLVHSLSGHASHVYHAIFTAGSSALVSCDLHGVVRSWSTAAETLAEVVTVPDLHFYDTTFRADIGGARSIALRSDGARVALGGITNVSNAFAGVGEVAVAVVDVADRRVETVLRSKDKVQGAVWGVAHHPAGFWLGVSGGGGGWLHCWKGNEPHEFFKLKLPSDGRGMGLSPDQRQLAVAHADGHLRLYALHAKTA